MIFQLRLLVRSSPMPVNLSITTIKQNIELKLKPILIPEPLKRLFCCCAAQIDRRFSHRFGLDEVQAAWELQATGECGKVILQPWG